MIRIQNIKLSISDGPEELKREACRILGVSESDVSGVEVLKKALDARRRQLTYIYTAAVCVKNEAKILKQNKNANVSKYEPKDYSFPYKCHTAEKVVIVGAGPAGLFAALALTDAGVKCILLERGRPMEERTEDVERFFKTGILDTASNVQFGEGGAGTFSDGKLHTGVNDIRINYVMRQFVRFGAPEDILYLSKPHIGTDRLRSVIMNMRSYLIAGGCDVRFRSRLEGITIEDGRVRSASVVSQEGRYELNVDRLILAIGNSARDTFEMLHDAGVPLSVKSFAVGVRIEHRQRDIDISQYGQPSIPGVLPPADYKLAVHLDSGRSVFSFCVCPGGYVVAATDTEGHVVTNGMSEYARDGENINGALLVGVGPEDFSGDPFKAVEFQNELERSAYRGGGENYCAPAQRLEDFLNHRPSKGYGKVVPTYRPGVRFTNLWEVLPEFVCKALEEAIPQMERKIKGFADPDAIITAVESRSSSPVRIERGTGYSSAVERLYPCGEGAGYAGGITSAAVDGIKCAEAVCRDLLNMV